MSDLKRIWNKVGGEKVVKQLFSEHIVFSTGLGVLSVGVSRKGLEIVRLIISLKLRNKLRRKMSKDAPELKIAVDKKLPESSVDHCPKVWVLWLQGEDSAPDVVRRCIESARKNMPDREVVVLTSENYNEYVSFPEHITRKFEAGLITRTHFSDLLRLELLTTYGGTWMDATVYFSNQPSDYAIDSDLFMFQLLKPGLDGHSNRISSWFITAQAPSAILLYAKELLYRYWEKYDKMVDYFLIHYFIEMAIEAYPEEWRKVVPSSNEPPHALLLRLGEQFNQSVFDGIVAQSSIHKLSYKSLPELGGGCFVDIILQNEGE